jgi:hypothetical protein
VVNIATAFLLEPLGTPNPVIKYAVNTVLALGVTVLLLVAARRVRTQPAPTTPADASAADLCAKTERKVP